MPTIDRIYNVRTLDDGKRACAIYITADNGFTYKHFVGGIPATGDIMTLLTARIDRLEAQAIRKNRVVDNNDKLATLTREDVVSYLRNELINANGNASDIQALYTQARAYEQANAQLSATMATFRTLHNVANPNSTITLTTNQGKAQYLLYFIDAVSLWS